MTNQSEKVEKNMYITMTTSNYKTLIEQANYLAIPRNNFILMLMFMCRRKQLDEIEIYYINKEIREEETVNFYSGFTDYLVYDFNQLNHFSFSIDQYVSALLHIYLKENNQFSKETKDSSKYRQFSISDDMFKTLQSLSDKYGINQTTFINFGVANDLHKQKFTQKKRVEKNKQKKQIRIANSILDKIPAEMEKRTKDIHNIISYFEEK